VARHTDARPLLAERSVVRPTRSRSTTGDQKASGVSIENLTVCNYFAGPGGQHGTRILCTRAGIFSDPCKRAAIEQPPTRSGHSRGAR
jgi:hypothetical protein